MAKGNTIPKLVSDILDVPEKEVKEVIVKMSLQDLVDIAEALKDNDKDKIFKIYNGYTL